MTLEVSLTLSLWPVSPRAAVCRVKVTAWKCMCQRCGHRWTAVGEEPPRACAGCKSGRRLGRRRPHRAGALLGRALPLALVAFAGIVNDATHGFPGAVLEGDASAAIAAAACHAGWDFEQFRRL